MPIAGHIWAIRSDVWPLQFGFLRAPPMSTEGAELSAFDYNVITGGGSISRDLELTRPVAWPSKNLNF